MKKAIIIIFLSTILGISPTSNIWKDGVQIWNNYLAGTIHMLFDFPLTQNSKSNIKQLIKPDSWELKRWSKV